MAEIAIRAQALTKRYRLYRRPADRLLDVFGLLRNGAGNTPPYTEHVALDGVSFEIARGEKVGIIGRNGAGKSTLLKLVTRSIEATSGTLEVAGATQALLSLGTGFHPDFTGRDNVINYLAQLGFAGARAESLTREIIAFAEVEEYIDQPVKTYSSGMGARLMFAASTVIEPDVLVVDEVLGVGDAYFARKSYERIKALCSEHGSTLLLVSHDIYSAAQICDRMIWIDRGRIKFDGPAKAAITLYEASVKEQEEIRLRRKAALAPREAVRDGGRQALAEIRTPDGSPFTGTLFFYEVALADGHDSLARIDPVTGRSDRESAKVTGNGAALAYEGSNWLSAEEAGRNDGIVLANFGQPYHKGVLRLDWRADIARPTLRLSLESATAQTVSVVVFDANQVGFGAGEMALAAGARTDWAVPLDTSTMTRVSDAPQPGLATRHGTGAIRVTSVDIVDAAGHSSRQLDTGEPVEFRFAYTRHEQADDQPYEIVAAFQKDGVVDVMRCFCSPLALPAGSETGVVSLRLPRLPLAPGRFTLTVLIAKHGYYERSDGVFYSINPNVVDVLNRFLEFTVKSAHPVYAGTAVAFDGIWSTMAAPAQRTS